MKFFESSMEELTALVDSYIKELSSPIDSFLEDHIKESVFFRIQSDDSSVGYFAVHENFLITQFYLREEYRTHGQCVFSEVRKALSVREAFVPTCDEFFLSHAMDCYLKLEKQAYFFADSGMEIKNDSVISLKPALYTDIGAIKKNSGDFFGEIEEKVAAGMIFSAERDGITVGYGIIEPGVLMKGFASIGMFTIPRFRQQGVGRSIIVDLKELCYAKGMKPIAGCWYYNHNSKKTLESAGMKSQTRLLRFGF